MACVVTVTITNTVISRNLVLQKNLLFSQGNLIRQLKKEEVDTFKKYKKELHVFNTKINEAFDKAEENEAKNATVPPMPIRPSLPSFCTGADTTMYIFGACTVQVPSPLAWITEKSYSRTTKFTLEVCLPENSMRRKRSSSLSFPRNLPLLRYNEKQFWLRSGTLSAWRDPVIRHLQGLGVLYRVVSMWKRKGPLYIINLFFVVSFEFPDFRSAKKWCDKLYRKYQLLIFFEKICFSRENQMSTGITSKQVSPIIHDREMRKKNIELLFFSLCLEFSNFHLKSDLGDVRILKKKFFPWSLSRSSSRKLEGELVFDSEKINSK